MSGDRASGSTAAGRPPSLRRRSSSASLKAAPPRSSTAAGSSSNGHTSRAGQIAAGVGAVKLGDDEDDDSSSATSSDDDEFEDAKGGASSASEAETKRAPPTRSQGVRGPPQPLKPGKSKAARLAVAKMEEDLTPRTKIGKQLHELTPQDVALTEDDIREDISVIWKAMCVVSSLSLARSLLETSAD